MNSAEEKQSAEPQEPSLTRPAVSKLASGVVSLLGVSGILYALGFLILRSRYSFLGIWGGIPLSSTEIAEEGGKFFYHLIYIPASLMLRLISAAGLKNILIVVVVITLTRGLTRMYLGAALKRRWERHGARPLSRLEAFFLRRTTLLPVLALLATAAMIELLWQVVDLDDVLRAPGEVFTLLELGEESARALYYDNILLRVFAAAFIAWALYRLYWAGAGRLQKGVIVAQWVLVLTALAALPIAYGKLALPSSFRVIQYPQAESGPLLLLAQTSDRWIVWNKSKKQTEVLTIPEAATVVIAGREDIFK